MPSPTASSDCSTLSVINCFDHAPAAGAQSHAHRHLAVAAGGARELKVGYIGAGNQHHKRDGAHEQGHVIPGQVAGNFFADVYYPGRPASVFIRVGLIQARRNRRHLGGRLLQRIPGLRRAITSIERAVRSFLSWE